MFFLFNLKMVFGHDEPRPTEENYRNFMDKFVDGLERLEENGLSLMIYGSYVRGDYVPGRSDIDAVLIFPQEVVIPKDSLQKASAALQEALKDDKIPFQVTVTDLTTMTDGRFNSYNPSFEKYFKEEEKVVVGPDYRGELKFEMSQYPDQEPLKFNLRKSRTGLLFGNHDEKEDYKLFLSKFNKTLDAVSRGSKQILFMTDGDLRIKRFSALETMAKIFPDVDVKPLEEIKYLYHNLDELDRLYRNSEELRKVWNSSVTFLEEMIRAYLRKFPRE